MLFSRCSLHRWRIGFAVEYANELRTEALEGAVDRPNSAAGMPSSGRRTLAPHVEFLLQRGAGRVSALSQLLC